MNPDTGDVRRFATPSAAKDSGYTIDLSPGRRLAAIIDGHPMVIEIKKVRGKNVTIRFRRRDELPHE